MNNNDELLISEHDSKTLFENSILRTNFIGWYDFKKDADIAIVGEKCPIIIDYLEDKGLLVTHFSKEAFLVNEKIFDYVLLLGVASDALIKTGARSVGDEGVLFVAVQNASGMMAKAKVPFFPDSEIGAYVKKSDIEKWLKKQKMTETTWYYPYPDYRLATEIYSDKHLPSADLVVEAFSSYEGDYLPAVDVKALYSEAVLTNQVSSVLNSFFVVCTKSDVSYVKFNTLRAPEFRLTTVLGDENREPFVEKRTQGEAARGHLAAIEKNHKLVLDSFNMIAPVGFERLSEDRVRFDFVNGRGLLDSVDFSELVLEKLVAVVEASLGTIFSTECDNLCSFEQTVGFLDYFGTIDVEAFLGKDALCVSNPDSIFDNFIFGDEIYLIDYEWMFDFPMPVDYLKYRALLYLYNGKRAAFENAGLSFGKLLEAFSYSEDVVEACERLELSFQIHIHGKDLRYNYLPHYQWRVWDKKDGVEFWLRQLKNKLK